MKKCLVREMLTGIMRNTVIVVQILVLLLTNWLSCLISLGFHIFILKCVE